MTLSYILADLRRNLRRTLTTVVGITVGVGLFCGVLFFIDGLTASMTQRSVSALTIDMQRIVQGTAGNGVRLHQTLEQTQEPGVSQVVLTVSNRGRFAAHEVTVRSQPQPGVVLKKGSAVLDGRPLPASGGTNPLATGSTGAGLNLGTLPAGSRHRISYRIEGDTPDQAQSVRSTVSTSETVSPVPANRPPETPLAELAAELAGIRGVATAEPLAIGALPDSSIGTSAHQASGPGRVFGFEPSFARRHQDIRLRTGSWRPDAAVVSAEVADALAIAVGDTVTLDLPDGSRIRLPVSGTADFSRARTLFSSRRGGDLETFQYTPMSLAVGSGLFADRIQPAYERALRIRNDFKTPPIREIDLTLDREALDADPQTALTQTKTVADAVMQVAPYQDDYLLDNISNTLSVAVADSAAAKRLFVFLGVPGALLAAMLSAYAGNVLAETQRREHAVLRIRGASRRQLLRILALHTTVITAAGSVVGLAVGYLATRQLLGAESLARARNTDLLTSAVLGTLAGFAATGLALYLTARRSVDREINEDRAAYLRRAPLWRRLHADLLIVTVVVIGTTVAVLLGAFAGAPGSVYFGRGVDLNLKLLLLPLAAWVGGSLVAARLISIALTQLDPGSRAELQPLRWRLAQLNIGRRPWPIANAAALVALIVALLTTLATFTASYDKAKSEDARFATGADLRVTQAPGAQPRLDVSDSPRLTSRAVPQVTPVVFATSNVILTSARTSDPANLAAVDPHGYQDIAPLHDEHFIDATSSQALSKIASDPDAVLLSQEMATFLKVRTGDNLDVLLARATQQQRTVHLHVVGLFTRLPGFPEGADALMDLTTVARAVPSTAPDFFLANAASRTDAALAAAVHALEAAPAGRYDLHVDTRRTNLSSDQSSLAALNIKGLVALDSGFALVMASIASGLFVFGLLLHRRREYVALRAQGCEARSILWWILAETGAVSIGGALAGIPVGIVMGTYFVHVLQPLFVLSPPLVVPFSAALIPSCVAIVAGGAAAVLGHWMVQRLDPAELLRDG